MERNPVRYASAPVSEVALGITFKESIVTQGTFFQLLADVEREYPRFAYSAPSPEETLQADQTLENVWNPLDTGPALYRFRSSDAAWVVSVQFNKVYLNWVRADDQSVGRYPGYHEILTRFLALVERLKMPEEKTEYCEFMYQDRIFWQDYVDDLGRLGEIMDFIPPRLKFGGQARGPIHLRSAFQVEAPELGGRISMVISPGKPLQPAGRQILSVASVIRGAPAAGSRAWFDQAHIAQHEIFEGMFRESVLESWKKGPDAEVAKA